MVDQVGEYVKEAFQLQLGCDGNLVSGEDTLSTSSRLKNVLIVKPVDFPEILHLRRLQRFSEFLT